MGEYLNPDNETFAEFVQNDTYVDKTGLIKYMNSLIGKDKRFIASSRPRRFGKTIAVRMLYSYYSKGCDSRDIFKDLEIAEDPSFEKNLNKYDVICLDIQDMRSGYRQDKTAGASSPLDFIQIKVLEELRQAYPEYVDEKTSYIADALSKINLATGNKFVIIIDEWDCFFREEKDNEKLLGDYIIFLRSLFKGARADRFVKLAYITGILPIKKYGTESALNNFMEFTMIEPGGIAPYIGFTEEEVRALCNQSRIPFGEMQKWYDGYIFDLTENTEGEGNTEGKPALMHVYSPNSVMLSIIMRKFGNYWTATETTESLRMYIGMDFDGLKQKVVEMLGGGRCRIVTQSFQNDMTNFRSASDVLTLLIHLGYLAYDSKTHEAFIPNEEVRDRFVNTISTEDWSDVYDAIQDSEKLLKATLSMDEKTVAKMIGDVHRKYSSSLAYNNEISLASVVQVAYYSAMREYVIVRELPTGEGFADMAFIPKRKSEKPAILVELKWDSSAEGAIAQIKGRKYAEGLGEYQGNMLLVGISYDKKTKEHQCRIEKA